MRIRLLRIGILAVASMAVSSVANAGYIELRFDDPAANGPANPGSVLSEINNFDGNTDSTGMSFTMFGAEVQCGLADDRDRDREDCTVTQDNEGLGVRTGRSDSNELDNYRGDEFLSFKFDEDVVLLGIDFEDSDSDDWAQIMTGILGGTVESGSIMGTLGQARGCSGNDGPFDAPADEGGSGVECSVMLDNPLQIAAGNWFTIAPWVGGSTSDMSIESLWFQGSSDSVPEPAVLGFMGFGLLGIGFANRRRKRA